ncbi:uncharacterized protein LOC124489832 [Dermatophagoides farinae]|uniref:Chch domain containing protein 2 n=1 Tax=Dermatophagoides farinae TaxID=6954 RepID=A0A922L5V4_DERFA|nr:uncharacterized protein LOC124489832 [Dermatophagoides farinae]KAH7646189.1 chch domain containing protein 2 [Dermatophagoides farinae]KAH9516569.1 hypothetical protein DERF_007304 [Dermatophagoides farinae]
MRTTQPLLWNKWMKNGRKPARPPYRFTECKKLELKDYVSGGDRHSSELACNSQMMDMMNCLKQFDFDEQKCSQQIKAFRSCYNTFLENQMKAKVGSNKNEPIPHQQKLTRVQVNTMLKRYPQPR